MATWSKLFSFFTWKNRPDTSTPLGQTLLNRLNTALNGIDDRVVTLNAEKASTDDIQGVFTDVRLIKNTGQFVFTLFDGTEKIIDTALEKISINVSFDQASQMMVLEKEDGSKEYVDLSAFTTPFEFVSSPTIQQTVTDGKVTANIKPNSITDQMLQTNYLADITTQANTALSASQSALESQSLAEQHAEDAEASADRAEEAANRAESVVGITIDTELSTSSTNPIANKAVAEEFEKYLPKSGGTVNGTLVVKGILAVGDTNLSEGVQDLLRNANRTVKNELGASGDYAFWDSTNSRYIIKSTRDGTNTFYGTANGNLPLTGGEVSGVFRAKTGSEYPLRAENQNSRNSYVAFYGTNGGWLGSLGFSEYIAKYRNTSGEGFALFHEGNKPTGTYTGNGDATKRTIAVGGISEALLVSNSANGIGIVTRDGAFVVYTDGNTTFLSNTLCKYENGVLTIATSTGLINANGNVYRYIGL